MISFRLNARRCLFDLQPFSDNVCEVIESPLRYLKFQVAIKLGHAAPEQPILPIDCGSPWHPSPRTGPEPIARPGNCIPLSGRMGPYILAGDIRNEPLKSVRLPIQNEAHFLELTYISGSLDAQKHAELQWHIKSRQPARRVELRPRKIMNAEPTFFYDRKYLLDSDLARVVNLKRASRSKTAMNDRKNDAVKERLVLVVKWAIDKDAKLVIREPTILLCARHASLQQQNGYRPTEPTLAPSWD